MENHFLTYKIILKQLQKLFGTELQQPWSTLYFPSQTCTFEKPVIMYCKNMCGSVIFFPFHHHFISNGIDVVLNLVYSVFSCETVGPKQQPYSVPQNAFVASVWAIMIIHVLFQACWCYTGTLSIFNASFPSKPHNCQLQCNLPGHYFPLLLHYTTTTLQEVLSRGQTHSQLHLQCTCTVSVASLHC